MPAWEYKFVTSGKGGFATPALMESFLNQLGLEEWEILDFHSQPDNPLAFSALARRSTQREWSLEQAVTAAARAEADKLRAEFEAKFKGATDGGGAEEPESASAEADGGDRTFRKPRDTESDLDPDLPEEEAEADEWDQIAKEDELPTFFEAIQPLMRRNQRGEGLSASVEHLAKKWGLSLHDVVAALKESGFVIPGDENERPAYVEYDGDLFWVNLNRRGELWINTKEKPRQVFRVVPGRPVADEAAQSETPPSREGREASGVPGDSGLAPPAEAELPESSRPEPAAGEGRHERRERQSDSPSRDQRRGLPEGQAILERIHPLMRRERGGSGRSGSIGFLSRALKCSENELGSALEALGLVLPAVQGEPPVQIDLGGATWWLNRDQRGGIWINQRAVRGERPRSAERENAEAQPSPAGTIPAEALGAIGNTEAKAGAPAPDQAATGAGEPAPALSGPSQEQAGPAGEAGAATAVPGGEAAVPPAARQTQNENQAAGGGGSSVDAGSSAGRGLNPDATVLSAARLLLKPTRTGAVAAEVGRLAENVGKSGDEFLSALLGAGLAVPDRPREKPIFVEHAGEIFWLNKNAKGELWLNAKASKFAGERRSGEGGEPGQPASELESRGRRGRRS